MDISTSSYESVFENYSSAVKWMEDLGVNTGSGRTSHYKKLIRYCKDTYKTASEDEIKRIFPDFVSSMFEVHDFIDIYEAFKDLSPNSLAHIVNKLQKAVNGPINSAHETATSSNSRNILFEAAVAARAHRPSKGIEAIFDAKSDTGISFGDKKIWIECKRVTTSNQIEKHIRKASKQLEGILQKQLGSGHRGIIAMDISKILQPGDQIFVCANDSELLESINKMMDQFIKEYSPIWQKVFPHRHRNIIGTIVRFSFMSSSEARKILVHSSQWGVNPRIGNPSSDDQLLRKLSFALKDNH